MDDVKILHLISAQPGTYLLHSGLEDDGSLWVNRSVVVAWAHIAGPDHLAIEPVTADGVRDGITESILPILHPDGRVEIPMDRSFETELEWRDYVGSEAKKEG